MKTKALISWLAVVLILLFTGCIQQRCPEYIEKECPPEVYVHQDNPFLFYSLGYSYKEFSFDYNHTRANIECKISNFEESLCYGLTYRVCKNEFESRFNIEPARCEIIFDFGDVLYGNNNVACGCWYKE